MNWNLFNQPAAHEWIRALCLTLMHSVWQGLVAAILAGCILLSTRKSKPALRYNLLALLMLAFVAGSIVTFGMTLRGSAATAGTAQLFSTEWAISNVPSNGGHDVIAAETNWIARVTGFFSTHAQLIVTLWFLVFALKSVQAATGLFYLNRIKKSVSEPHMKWVVRFYELAERMGISQEIELAESAHITVPMVIGFLKPVVLVPLGMLTNLPVGQVEAILLHELAHIRRRDYLINLVQIFCENVFFFNPAVLWISKLIRDEREHCCDDLAIHVMQNKTSFIHALVSFQEYNQSRPAFEMAFSKKRNHLLDRIKRIVNNNNKPLDAMEKLFVTFSLAAAIALSAATAPEKTALRFRAAIPAKHAATVPDALPAEHPILEPDTVRKKKKESVDTEIHSANVHSAREGISTYNVTRNNRQYEIVQRNGKIISLWIDNAEIPASDYGKYQPEIDKIMTDIKVQHELAEKQREKAEEMRAVADVQRKEAEKQRAEAVVLRLEAEKDRERVSELRLYANKNRDEAETLRLDADKYREKAEVMRKEADKMRLDAEKLRKEADEHRADAEVYRKNAEEQRAIAEKERQAYIKIQDGIIDDLTKAGLVKNKESLSYKLSNEELVVNGAKQSADLHQKLKSKYMKEMGDKKFELMYNYSNGNGHIKTGIIHSSEE